MLVLKDVATPRETESNFREDMEEPLDTNIEEENGTRHADNTQLSDTQSQSSLANEQPVQVQPLSLIHI